MVENKRNTMIILTVIITLLMFNISLADNNKKATDYIEIGLFFRDTSKSSICLKSTTGFEVGKFVENEFIPLLDLSEEKMIVLQNDTHGGNNGEKYLAYEINDDFKQYMITTSPSSTGVQVIDSRGNVLYVFNSESDIYFRGFNNGSIPVIDVEGKQYRGAITAKRVNGGDMTIVNKLALDEYLYGVIPNEMPALWPMEALKAQAVVARGYALMNMNKFRSLGFDLCSTTSSQAYGGFDKEHPNTNSAVMETKSAHLTYNGQLVDAFYHANSGGCTEDSENIWFQPIPYIRSVRDDFSLGHPNSVWNEILTKDQIKALLEKENIFIGDIIAIKITSISPNGRVLELTIQGSNGQETLLKERARLVLGLKSTWFTINGNDDYANRSDIFVLDNKAKSLESSVLKNEILISAKGISQIKDLSNVKIFNGITYNEGPQSPKLTNNSFEFNGRGHGHGLGMSQWGAKKMAEEGYSYLEILNHYYTDTKVEYY